MLHAEVSASSLKNYAAVYGNEDDVVLGPDILGIGRYFVKPQYIEDSINVPDDMNSLTSAERQTPYRDWETDRKSTRLNSSHRSLSRMPSSA